MRYAIASNGIRKITTEALGIPGNVEFEGLMDTKVLYLLGFRHKKRRPWTSFFDHLVGRGNLK